MKKLIFIFLFALLSACETLNETTDELQMRTYTEFTTEWKLKGARNCAWAVSTYNKQEGFYTCHTSQKLANDDAIKKCQETYKSKCIIMYENNEFVLIQNQEKNNNQASQPSSTPNPTSNQTSTNDDRETSKEGTIIFKD